MKIAITQRDDFVVNNIQYDCLERGWYNIFKNHEIISVPNGCDFYDIGNFDLLVLAGGNSSPDRKSTEEIYIMKSLEKGIPIMGVCRGAFILNAFFNGQNSTIDGHQNVDHDILLEGKIFSVNSYHKLAIDKLGNDLIMLAETSDHIEAFRHKEKNIWGLVWHPERMETPVLPKDLAELINE